MGKRSRELQDSVAACAWGLALRSLPIAIHPFSLQRQVLQHLLAVQQKAGSAEAADTLARLEAVAGGSTEEEEEPECSEPLEESDLELSESGERWAQAVRGCSWVSAGGGRSQEWGWKRTGG